jgi:3-dehydroquinate dehydratase-2
MRIRVINGPNLNQLGNREPEIYGSQTYDALCQHIQAKALKSEIEVEILQSHYEGQLIEWILEQESYDGLIINPAAYSHYSIALLDALKMVKKEVIEVHLTNIHQREAFRQTSVTAKGARGVIAGFGFDSYLLAMDYLINCTKNI